MEFTFKPLSYTDLPLLADWLAKTHVSKWWRESAEMDQVIKRYGPYIDKTKLTDFYLAVINSKPIGMIQTYLVDDYPEHAKAIRMSGSVGVDLFIGEEDFIGKGYGPILLSQFVEEIIRNKYTGTKLLVADPEVANTISIRAFKKAGFKKGNVVSGEYGPEQLMIFSL